MDTQTQIVEIKVENAFKGASNYISRNLLECMRFWNNTGIAELQIAREEEPDEHTKAFDDEVLDKMLIDCRTFCNSDTAKRTGKFECGRTRSHVWVHMNDERMFMFYTNVAI